MAVLRRYSDQCVDNLDGTVSCYNSAWDDWARWLVLALIIIAALLLFFSFSCITARRRRRMGYQPYRGTGWALGRTPPGHGAATYNQQPYYQQQPYYNNSNNPGPPPEYTPPPNHGYYGNDVELQQPQNVYGGYRSGEGGAYQPPKGPPPGRI